MRRIISHIEIDFSNFFFMKNVLEKKVDPKNENT